MHQWTGPFPQWTDFLNHPKHWRPPTNTARPKTARPRRATPADAPQREDRRAKAAERRLAAAKAKAKPKATPKAKAAAVAASAQPAVDKKGPSVLRGEEELPSPKGKGRHCRKDRTVKQKRKHEAGQRHPSRDEKGQRHASGKENRATRTRTKRKRTKKAEAKRR